MAVAGVFASDQNIVGSRVGDFASSLLRVNPSGSAPMFALTSGMPSESAQDTIVNWFEEVKLTGRKAVTSVNGDGDSTSFTVADASDWVAGTVLLVEETGEFLYVTAVSTNTLTVTRGIGSSTQTTITTSHTFYRVGNAQEEGSALPTAVANLGDVRFNVTQIFRNTWSVTGTVKAIKYHTGNQVAKNRADCAFLHAEDIERAILWSRKHIGALNGQPFRIMDGLVTQLENHGGISSSQSSSVQWSDFLTFFRQVFATNIKGKPNERIAFSGNIAVDTLNLIAHLDGTINMTAGQTDFGLEVVRLRTPHGSVTLMTHPLMNESSHWQKTLYVFHPGAILTKYLRRTQIEGYDANGRRIDGKDADQGVYTTEMTVQLMAAQTSGKFTGIDTAAVQT